MCIISPFSPLFLDLIVGAFGVDTAVLYRYVLLCAFTKVNEEGKLTGIC